MQVAVDARYLCDPFGSMTVFCGNLLRALVDMDLDVKPVALLPRRLHPSAYDLRDELGERVRWIRLGRDRYRLGRLIGELRWVHHDVPSLLAHEVAGTDVVIMPYHHPPFRATGVRRVVVLHDLCGLGTGFPKHKKAYWRHYLRLRAAAHLADAIWPISRATRDHMASRFPAARRRLGPVVYNGVEREPVSATHRDAVLEHHGLERGTYVVAFATWQERKNFAASLAALEVLRYRSAPVRLVGITPRAEMDTIDARCKAAGHDDAVLLSGIPDDELDALYAGALALLWPSTCEGFGYPIVEAMLQGCVPLVGNFGPGAELVAGAVEPLSSLGPDAIADRLHELRALGTYERDRLREDLQTRAAAFSADNYCEQLKRAMASLESMA